MIYSSCFMKISLNVSFLGPAQIRSKKLKGTHHVSAIFIISLCCCLG